MACVKNGKPPVQGPNVFVEGYNIHKYGETEQDYKLRAKQAGILRTEHDKQTKGAHR
jgi:hypothetical protein